MSRNTIGTQEKIITQLPKVLSILASQGKPIGVVASQRTFLMLREAFVMPNNAEKMGNFSIRTFGWHHLYYTLLMTTNYFRPYKQTYLM